jgi:hypothetical protein
VPQSGDKAVAAASADAGFVEMFAAATMKIPDSGPLLRGPFICVALLHGWARVPAVGECLAHQAGARRD